MTRGRKSPGGSFGTRWSLSRTPKGSENLDADVNGDQPVAGEHQSLNRGIKGYAPPTLAQVDTRGDKGKKMKIVVDLYS